MTAPTPAAWAFPDTAPDIIRTAAAIVREAGAMLANADRAGIVTDEKGDPRNTVTQYDRRSQAFLEARLTAAFDGRPDPVSGRPVYCRFVSEEEPEGDAAARQISLPDAEALLAHGMAEEEWLFIIDPLDGTANFRYDLHYSAISVALLTGGEVRYGLVYNPYADELFWAVRDGGAFVNDRPIRVTANRFLEKRGMVGFGSSPYRPELSRATLEFLLYAAADINDVRRSGTAALDLCALAAGRLDVFFEMSLYPWDFAAGALICREAGAVVTDMDGTPPVIPRRGSILAANPVAHREFRTLYDAFRAERADQ